MFLKYYLFLIEIVLALSIILRRKNPVTTPLFIGFMAFTFVVEVIAITLAEKYDVNNLWLYNIYLFIAFLCWFYWFAYKAGLKKQAAFVACFYFILGVADFLFFQKSTTLNSYSYIAGTFGYVCLFVIWIYNILKKEKSFADGSTLLFFTAGLGYFTGFTIDIVLYPTGMLSKIIYGEIDLDVILVDTVNTFFYGLLCIAIIAGYYRGNKKEVKSAR